MKEVVLSLLFVLCLIISCSCGNEPTGSPIGTEDVAVTTGGSPETNAPETDPPATTAAVTTTAPGTTTSPAPSTTVPVTTAPITTAPPATTVPATTQDLSPTKPYNSVLAKYPEPIEKVPITSVNGIDNEEAIKLISGLILHNYNIYRNICIGGHLPYDESTVKEEYGMIYAKVTSGYFKSVEDILNYISLCQGISISKNISIFDKLEDHLVEYMYFDKEDGLYINLNEVRLGMKLEKWESISIEITEIKNSQSGHGNIYYATVEALLKESRNTKSYKYVIGRIPDNYVEKPITYTYLCYPLYEIETKYITVDEDVKQLMFDLAKENDKWLKYDFYQNDSIFGKYEETYSTEKEGYYKLISNKYKSVADIYEYFDNTYLEYSADELANMWFFEKDGTIYKRRWWNPPYTYFGSFYPVEVNVTYFSDIRCEFVVHSQNKYDSNWTYIRYFVAVCDTKGNWRLVRHYGLEDDNSLVEPSVTFSIY